MKNKKNLLKNKFFNAGILFLFYTFLIIAHAESKNSVVDLIGYNYTDRNIVDYSINGQSGGTIILSSPTSGGSGNSCCIRLASGRGVPIIVGVRWQVDGCTYLMRSEISKVTQRLHYYFYREDYVEVEQSASDNPTHLESHFYPDGTVKVMLTDNISFPRLSLNKSRPDQSKFPKCKDDKKPK